LSKHAWEISELVGLLEAEEAKMVEHGAMKRGKYKAKSAD
jgi:hypothetical protein